MSNRPLLYNALTVLFLLLTLGFLGWAGWVFGNPQSTLNPFPPPPLPTVRVLPPLVVTAGPMRTPQPPTLTFMPRPTSTAALTPTQVLPTRNLNTATTIPTATSFIPTRSPTPTVPAKTATAQAIATITAQVIATQTVATQALVAQATVTTAAPATTAPAPLVAPQAAQPASGGFELGGQVAGFGYPDQMKQAGMLWVKRQLRWSPGSNPSDAAGDITDAHNKGFKILLSVLGDPESLRGGANYDSFAAYTGEVAALGADALEIWNEMNIDREWPGGEINAAAYTQLLKGAYTAIKARNPATLVISGAPAPTGFFGGCSGAGCDDNFYVQGMVKAGALNYLDCIGIHYNEGVLSPTLTSGDPRGNPNHYTRYYQTMVDTYYNAAGGRRKLCFTELGYVSGDGYNPSLSEAAPGFAWAAGTSVDEQAQWLAEAVSLSRNNGKVRLLIVFNVDLTGWGADPQGGYAIIRPNGGCPACETLHGVTGGR